jgi:hypothetical protein
VGSPESEGRIGVNISRFIVENSEKIPVTIAAARDYALMQSWEGTIMCRRDRDPIYRQVIHQASLTDFVLEIP